MTEKLFDLFFSSLLISAQAVWVYLLQSVILRLWNALTSLLTVG